MSKLYIKDLENIVNGEIKRYSFTGNISNSFIPLSKIDKERKEVQWIRNQIINEFLKDLHNELDNRKNGIILPIENIVIYRERLFFENYFLMEISSILGNAHCLFNEEGLVSCSNCTDDLKEKEKLFLPYIKKMFEVKKNSKVLDNEFYEDIPIYNENKEKVLNMHGGGIYLPFNDYDELPKLYLQELLHYYYCNWNNILNNILVSNDSILERFRIDFNKEKVLKLYKGEK